MQRFYERDEERYIELIWPQVGEVHDLDFIEKDKRGVFYGKGRPLIRAARQGAKKKSEDIGATGPEPEGHTA